jgi:hypothetical protein
MTSINVNSYTLVAEARGQRVLFYRQFGSYQGEWLLLSADDDHYFLYRDSYGSCSGCDALESRFGYNDDGLSADDPRIQEFIKEYEPFLVMQQEAALRVAQKGSLLTVIPANRRDWYDIPAEQVGIQLALIVKAEQGVITPVEILQLDNLEGRRAAIEGFGAERFAKEVGGEVRDETNGNRLVAVSRKDDTFVFLDLQDASTPRRYVLRVPPETKTVKEGVAWSFNLPASEFHLVAEA